VGEGRGEGTGRGCLGPSPCCGEAFRLPLARPRLFNPPANPQTLLRRSVITYSALISACEKAGQWEAALELFGRMTSEGCAPNVITYNSLITACGQVRASPQPASRPSPPSPRATPRSLPMPAHCPCCSIPSPRARAFLRRAFLRPAPFQPSIPNAPPKQPPQGAQWQHAADIFAQMQRGGCRPDVVTYTALIGAYERGGEWLRALETFRLVRGPSGGAALLGAWRSGPGRHWHRARVGALPLHPLS
jgi:pentatricopeptide repeat protein